MNDKPSPSKPRRRWYLQFSLRSVFLLTAAVAVWAAWYRQPDLGQIDLGDGMTLRVNLRGEERFLKGIANKPTIVQLKHGPCELVDKYGRVLLSGRYEDDLPQGRWTYYRDNGRRAMTGMCTEGYRVGLWRAWHENGRRRFEIEHGQPKEIEKYNLDENGPGCFSTIPVVGCSSFGLLMSGRGISACATMGFGFSGYSNRSPWNGLVSHRHGDARWWWDNGCLRAQGQHLENRRAGTWTFFDEQGNQTAQRTYLHGERHGPWRLGDAAASDSQMVRYAGGREVADYDRLASRLAKQVQEGNWRQRYDALCGLSRLGGESVEKMAPALKRDEASQRLVLRLARRMGTEAAPLATDIEPLTTAESRPLCVEALLTLLEINPRNGATWLPALVAETLHGDKDQYERLIARVAKPRLWSVDALEEMLSEGPLRYPAMDALYKMLDLLSDGSFPIGSDLDEQLEAVFQRAANHDDPQIVQRARFIVDHWENRDKGEFSFLNCSRSGNRRSNGVFGGSIGGRGFSTGGGFF